MHDGPLVPKSSHTALQLLYCRTLKEWTGNKAVHDVARWKVVSYIMCHVHLHYFRITRTGKINLISRSQAYSLHHSIGPAQ